MQSFCLFVSVSSRISLFNCVYLCVSHLSSHICEPVITITSFYCKTFARLLISPQTISVSIEVKADKRTLPSVITHAPLFPEDVAKLLMETLVFSAAGQVLSSEIPLVSFIFPLKVGSLIICPWHGSAVARLWEYAGPWRRCSSATLSIRQTGSWQPLIFF